MTWPSPDQQSLNTCKIQVLIWTSYLPWTVLHSDGLCADRMFQRQERFI